MQKPWGPRKERIGKHIKLDAGDEDKVTWEILREWGTGQWLVARRGDVEARRGERRVP